MRRRKRARKADAVMTAAAAAAAERVIDDGKKINYASNVQVLLLCCVYHSAKQWLSTRWQHQADVQKFYEADILAQDRKSYKQVNSQVFRNSSSRCATSSQLKLDKTGNTEIPISFNQKIQTQNVCTKVPRSLAFHLAVK